MAKSCSLMLSSVEAYPVASLQVNLLYVSIAILG